MNKLNDLYDRCGARPSIANVGMSLQFDENGDYHYTLIAPDAGQAPTDKEAEAIEKATALLGFGENVVLKFPNLESVEEVVDRALSVAPRARAR